MDKAGGTLSNTAHLAEWEMLLKSCKAGRLWDSLTAEGLSVSISERCIYKTTMGVVYHQSWNSNNLHTHTKKRKKQPGQRAHVSYHIAHPT